VTVHSVSCSDVILMMVLQYIDTRMQLGSASSLHLMKLQIPF